MAKIIFIPLDIDGYLFNSGSRMIRVDWIIPHLKADVYDRTQDLEEYDVIIYQKAFMSKEVQILSEKYKHKLQIFDVCDPEHIFKPYEFQCMVDRCEFITVSNEELKIELEKKYNKPVYILPDRVNLDFFKVKKTHIDKIPKIVWFGYQGNFQYVKYWRPELEASGLDLICITEEPCDFGSFVKWEFNSFCSEIIKGDIVFNPKGPFKSNNKTLISWALGMPVAYKPEEIKKFLNVNSRIEEAEKRLQEVKSCWDVKLSAWELNGLIIKHLRRRDE